MTLGEETLFYPPLGEGAPEPVAHSFIGLDGSRTTLPCSRECVGTCILWLRWRRGDAL
jgi:hypothetical protein